LPKETQSSSTSSTATRRPSLKLNALSNWGPLGVNFIVGFLLTPYLIGHLGKENYGIWVLVGSLLGYYGLLRLGVGAGIMRYVPFYIGGDDNKSTSEIVSTGLAIFMLVGLVIFAVSILLAEPIARFYKSGSELASLVRILGTAAAFACPMYILDACIRSHEHWIAANFVTIASSVARALGLAGCVYFGYTIIEMGYVVLVVTAFSMALTCVVFVRSCPGIYLRPSMIKLSSARILLSFGILTTIITLAYTLTLQGHSLIIGKVISMEAVAVYAIPVLLIRNIRQGLLAPARVFWPRFAYLDGKNRSEEITSLFLRGTRLTAMFASGVMLIVFVLGPSFIRLWVGEDFRAGERVLPWLAAGYLVYTSQGTMGLLLSATGRQGKRALIATIEGVIGFAMSLSLGLKIGMSGVAIGFTISSLLIYGAVLPWYVCRILKVNLALYYLRHLVRPWTILLILVVLVRSAGVEGLVNSWGTFILVALALALTYCISVFIVATDVAEKRGLLNFLQRRVLGFSPRSTEK